jgi:putrescine transport system permease protein
MTWVTRTALVAGLCFLYAPILVLIGYSFNASPLVTVWGGFSSRWYGALFSTRPCLPRPGSR